MEINPNQKRLWRSGLLAKIGEYRKCAALSLGIASMVLEDMIARDLQELGGMAGEW